MFTASNEKPRDHSEIGWRPPFPPPPPPPRALLLGDELEGVAGPRDDEEEDIEADEARRDDDDDERDLREEPLASLAELGTCVEESLDESTAALRLVGAWRG